MNSKLPKKSEACIGVDVIPMLKQLKVVGNVSIQDVSSALYEVLCTGHYSIKPRFMLEASTTELHFIPYIRIVNAARTKVMVYQRPSRDDGEARLDGMYSIGTGGHPDSNALDFNDHVLNIDTSLRRAALDELRQEIRVLTSMGSNVLLNDVVASFINPIGMIYDPSDDVGLTHVAVLFELVVPDEATFKSNSPTEVRDPHWCNIAEALNSTSAGETAIEATYTFENWSRLWLVHSLNERVSKQVRIQ